MMKKIQKSLEETIAQSKEAKNIAISRLKQKVLDKTPNYCYNIRKDGEGALAASPLKVYGKEGSFKIPVLTLKSVGQAIRDMKEDSFVGPDIGNPVVSGGFLRDMFVGTSWNDIDIFFGFGPDVDIDEVKDTLEFAVGHYTKKYDLPYTTYRFLGKNYDGTEELPTKNSKVLAVLEIMGLFNNTVQFIATNLDPDLEKNYLDLLNDFPYNTTKGVYLPSTDDIIITSEMAYDLQNKVISVTDKRGVAKASRFQVKTMRKCGDKDYFDIRKLFKTTTKKEQEIKVGGHNLEWTTTGTTILRDYVERDNNVWVDFARRNNDDRNQ